MRDAGDFIGIESSFETMTVSVYTDAGFQRFTVNGFDNPSSVFPSSNGCAGACFRGCTEAQSHGGQMPFA